ncbi:hypothetical protein LPJ66_005473 [Kickxella alabastrina]|uniref:Uncharacterized protein n=1 Tax=Kickxella alabastrina TaxID=61397 RepID=A0ACC1IMF7_9FUNG|nr:hypothetical protein LPJ66_005473 [Kickxella alabastrina]
MCTVMGGSVHHVGTMLQCQRFVESFAPSKAIPNSVRSQGLAAALPGVLVNFERIDDNPANHGNSDLRVLLHAPPNSTSSMVLPPPTEAAGGVVPANNANARGPGAGIGSNSSYGNSAGVTALINGHLGYFPIPESFWPETISQPRAPGQAAGGSHSAPPATGNNSNWQIQRRSAHPTLGYSQVSTEWTVPPQFPFDKYQIDTHCNVAQKLLAATQAAQNAHESQGGKGPAKPVCWPVFVNGSYTTPKNSGFPFGILRSNTARTAVNLYVLPYNYTALWKILGKLDAQVQGQNSSRAAVAMSAGWRREFEEYLQHTPGYYAIPLKRAFNLFGIPHGVFPKTFGQSPGMRNITAYSLRIHNVARKDWDRLHPGSGIEGGQSGAQALSEQAVNLQQALLSFSPASDASHLVANAFDVDRAHCLATLSAMRRVFVRECMAGQGAYFRANAIVPPSSGSSETLDAWAMDIDGDGHSVASLYLPPVASMEYALYGGMDMAKPSPLGGPVDVASEDDRDSRHSVPIRIMGEFGAAMHLLKAHEARDPLLDERVAMQQRRNMFGNPYRRPPREPRGPTNNILARNPQLSAMFGASRSQPKSPATLQAGGGPGGGQRVDLDDEAAASAGLELENEAEVNELAMDKMVEDLPLDVDETNAGMSGSRNTGGQFWWLKRREIPRRRSINKPWRKNDDSWNVNPWDMQPEDTNGIVIEPGSLTYTADSYIINKCAPQTVTPVSSAAASLAQSLVAASPDMVAAEGHSSFKAELPELDATQQSPASSDMVDVPENSDQNPSFSLQQSADDTESLMVIDPPASDPDPAAPKPLAFNTEVSRLVAANPQEPQSHVLVPMQLPEPAPKPVSVSVPVSVPASVSAPVRKINVPEEKAWFLKHIKADPAHYDEDAILERFTELQANMSLGKPQLKIIVTAAINTAKAMRRKQLVLRLEENIAKS